jgi:hypothetical protein
MRTHSIKAHLIASVYFAISVDKILFSWKLLSLYRGKNMPEKRINITYRHQEKCVCVLRHKDIRCTLPFDGVSTLLESIISMDGFTVRQAQAGYRTERFSLLRSLTKTAKKL